jgi:hypothetical protein
MKITMNITTNNYVWCLCKIQKASSVLFIRQAANPLQRLALCKVARLQAGLHADYYALRNLAPPAVDIAPVDGGIREAESGCNDL